MLFHMNTSLKHFVNDCLWKPLFDSNSPQTPTNFFLLLTILVTLRPFTLFQPNRVIKLQKSAKICLTSTEFEI